MHEKINLARSLIQNSKNPVSFSGAGLSAESGIAVFRSAESSADKAGEADNDRGEKPLWEQFDPQTLASQFGFVENPQIVLEWYAWRRGQVAAASPNAAHRVLAAQHNMLHITQNVDDLLERAGTDSEQVVHLHGEIVRDKCNAHCGYSTPLTLSADAKNNVPSGDCPDCGAPLRPGVVWFGEALPETLWQLAVTKVSQCDFMLVVGTSALVNPAAGLIELARSNGASIVIVDPAFAGAQETLGSKNDERQEILLSGNAGDVLPLLFNLGDE